MLVIETGLKGGTMHTVRFAGDQGRPLACIDHPEHLHSEGKVQGNRKLIAEGTARPIADGSGFTAFLNGLGPKVPVPGPALGSGGAPAREAEDPQISFGF